jgi:hypothetical protein
MNSCDVFGVEGERGVRLTGMIPKEQNNLENQQKIKVTVVDIKMPFSSMVLFMVKWAVASIPALTILLLLGVFALGLMGSLLPGMCKFFIKSLIWG